jgi:hypothetical protein
MATIRRVQARGIVIGKGEKMKWMTFLTNFSTCTVSNIEWYNCLVWCYFKLN